jgi:hypothetical protein
MKVLGVIFCLSIAVLKSSAGAGSYNPIKLNATQKNLFNAIT